MMDSFRKSFVTLVLHGPLGVANGVATFIATHRARIASAQLGLPGTGTGAGATTVQVNINGVPVSGAGNLSIAGAAAGKAVSSSITLGSNQFPGGALINPGDVITVDVLAVPATTVPAGGAVILDLTQVDV
jgi:hypothetical protein